MINLIRNAVQAIGGVGRVWVTSRVRKDRAGEAAAWIEISVRDEGPGIAPHVLEKLFLPFFTTKATGTGLGLAISQRVVEEMGGRIEVASRPGFGSTFTVVLPRAKQDPAQASVTRAALAPPVGFVEKPAE